MKKIYQNLNAFRICFCLFALITIGQFTLTAQPYYFTASSGVFTPLSGATPITSIQTGDELSPLINIGFLFKYNGRDYVETRVSSNGFLSLAPGISSSSFSVNDTSFIAPLGDDISGYGGTASYKTEGTAPNRVFTVEWLNWRWSYTATSAGISFQVKLYETINRIEFIYRQEPGVLVSPSAYIGLSFQTLNKYMFLSNSGTSPVIETTTRHSVSTKPATGQVYRFDTNIFPEPSNHVTAFSNISVGNLAVEWTDATGTTLPTRYLIKVSNVSFAAITNPVDGAETPTDLDLKDGTGAVYCGYGVGRFNGWADSIGNTTYYMKIFSLSNSGANCNYKTDGAVAQLKVDVPYLQARNLTFTSIQSQSITLNWVGDLNTNCVVFAKENGTGKSSPANNTTYTGNAVYGSGTQIGSTGWYCVYNGPATTITVTGLKKLTSYGFHVVEYTGNAGAEQYFTADVPSAYANQATNIFVEQTAVSLPGVVSGDVSWADQDNDNDLDMIITGAGTSNWVSKTFVNNGAGFGTGTTLTAVSNVSTDWCDYDFDGDMDVLINGWFSGANSSSTRLYNNDGAGNLTENTNVKLAGGSMGSVDWGDYDNDGFPDIVTMCSTGTRIYRNNHNGNFIEVVKFPALMEGEAIWGDYNNDGYADLFLCGYWDSKPRSYLYKNKGDGTFEEQSNHGIDPLYNSCAAWGDYNGDGYLDLIIAGSIDGYTRVTKIYKNMGDGTLAEQTDMVLPGVHSGDVDWGDLDNDGDLDIVLAGSSVNGRIAKVFLNNGNGFTEEKKILLPGVDECSIALGDYDNDKDLDILLAGESGTDHISKIFRNDADAPNIVPAAPAGLEYSVAGQVATLKWNKVTGDASTGLTYNVRIGKTSGANDVVSSQSYATGLRKLPAMGNAFTRNSLVLNNLKKGTYYWSVQAVDNNFAGGPYAAEQTFTYDGDYPATHLTVTAKSGSSVLCSWIRGNGDNCLVFAKENGTGKASPVNSTTYTGDKAFGTGTQIGTTGWYCVYNGDEDTATIYNLKPNTVYSFHVIEYTGTTGAQAYYTTDGVGNPAQYTPAFTEQAFTLTGVSGHTNAWGDYDNDGDLDLILGGNTGSAQVVELYTNNGDNTFTKSPATFAVNIVYDILWGDYDNDNDLDLLILSSINSKVFENKGDGTFTAKANLADVFTGKGQWVDFDNDGFKDIIFTGMGGTKIYKNNQDGTFTIQTHTLPTVSNYSAVACGDYDNDGDMDVLLSGQGDSEAITKVFKNDGNFSFVEQTSINNLPGISNCSVAWADMDNDGDLDIIMSGADFNFATKIYDNAGNNTFTEIAGPPFKELNRSSLAIADYDNDGDRDILVSGTQNDADYYTILYSNNGNKTYSEVKTISFPGIQYGSLNWGDYDNDNDLDLFLCGTTATGRISKVFRNNGSVFNTKPGTVSYSYSLNGNDIKISWYKTTDDKTSSSGLSYNLYVYETSKAVYNKSGEVFPYSHALAGRKLVASFGDIQYNTTGYTIKGLPYGNYKISMQAVDAGMLGGDFRNEVSFSIYDLSVVGINVVESKLTNTNDYLKYSLNSTDGVNGTWNFCYNTTTNVNFPGGVDVWVRQTNNPDNKRKIASIPAVADAPSPAFTINYIAETTSENIPATIEAYAHSSMTGIPLIGEGKPMQVTPGTSLYFRFKGTATTLPSKVQTLTVPARPVKPTVTLSYTTERTVQAIPASMEYDPLFDMPNPTTGTGATVQVAPNQTLYFRYKASTSSFKSDKSYVYAPDRPWSPNFNIDYRNESTEQPVTSEEEYSASEAMADAVTGSGQKVTVIPGQKLYIRLKATNTVYCSSKAILDAPARPTAPQNLVINDELNTCNWDFDNSYLLLSDYEFSVNGGTTWANCPARPLNIGNINLAAGELKIRIKASVRNFKGHEAASASAFTISSPAGVASFKDAGIKMYPTPATDILYLENLPAKSVIYIFNLNGKLVIQKAVDDENMKISVADLPQGLYVLKIRALQQEYQSKFTKQ